jgi:hypothetical protein
MADNNAKSAKPSGSVSMKDAAVPQHKKLAADVKVDTGCGTGKKVPK